MTRDYASSGRKKAKASRGSASPRGNTHGSSPPWVWFLAGLLCGVFLAALTWLASQRPAAVEAAAIEELEQHPEARQGPRFDFYTLLPEQRIDLDVDPETLAAATQPVSDQYLLQAGSFKKPQDADRRRAELLLLGLDAEVEEANGDNGRWFRVYIGPFESRSRLARARSLTAQQGIDTLLLRRPGGEKPGAP